MKNYFSAIILMNLMLCFFLFSCQEKATEAKKLASKSSVIEKPKPFRLDTSDQKALSIHHIMIEDEENKSYDLYALNHHDHLYTKLYLLKDQACLDSMYLTQNSPTLVKFELLPSKKKVHAIYTHRSTVADPNEQQAIITVKDQKIAIPFTLPYEVDIESSIGAGSNDILNKMYHTNKIDLQLLDANNQCVVKFVSFEKMYDFKTKKFTTKQDKGTRTYYYDPKTQAFCDSVRYFDLPYKDCQQEQKRLRGKYPVREYGEEGDGGLYFNVFTGREWHIYVRGWLMPNSEPCYHLF